MRAPAWGSAQVPDTRMNRPLTAVKSMTIDEIRELIRLVHETGITELEVQRGENRVRIRSGINATAQEILLAAGQGGSAVHTYGGPTGGTGCSRRRPVFPRKMTTSFW